VISNGGLSGNITNGTTDFLYTGWQCVEERDSSDDPQKQYIWGTYIDELIQQKIDISGTPADQYPLQDLLYRTIALTNSSGSIIEAYDYDAYGNTLIFTAPGTASNWFANDATQSSEPTCSFLFTGRRYDPEWGGYWCRSRGFLPGFGRFISRDILFFVGQTQGLYAYVNGHATHAVDPYGLMEDGVNTDVANAARKIVSGENGKTIDYSGRQGIDKAKNAFADKWQWGEQDIYNMLLVRPGAVYTFVQPGHKKGLEYHRMMPRELVGNVDSWDATRVGLIEDIELWLREKKRPCLDTLILTGHGVSESSGTVGLQLGDDVFSPRFITSTEAKWLSALMCKDGVVLIFSCDSDAPEKTTKALKELDALLGVNVCACPSHSKASRAPFVCFTDDGYVRMQCSRPPNIAARSKN
jgi:RHS repeat-associated protein